MNSTLGMYLIGGRAIATCSLAGLAGLAGLAWVHSRHRRLLRVLARRRHRQAVFPMPSNSCLSSSRRSARLSKPSAEPGCNLPNSAQPGSAPQT
jgi:hypothetical protein